MSGKLIAGLGAIVVVGVIVGVMVMGDDQEAAPDASPQAVTTAPSSDRPDSSQTATVRYTSDGTLSPEDVTVKVGQTVTFINESDDTIQLDSDPHPSHTSFPPFNNNRPAPGKSFQFTFKEPMTLKYHNHLRPSANGSVTVKN